MWLLFQEVVLHLENAGSQTLYISCKFDSQFCFQNASPGMGKSDPLKIKKMYVLFFTNAHISYHMYYITVECLYVYFMKQ